MFALQRRLKKFQQIKNDWSGIRTRARRLVPETSALDHSAIQPIYWPPEKHV